MRPSGRPTAPFSVSAAAARPPPGLVHRKAAAAARSRAAAALVMLVSAAALFFVVAARGSGGIDHEASPLSTAASSSRPSVRPSVGTRSVSASGGEEKSDKRVEAAAAAAAEEDGAEDASSKKSCAPPPLQPPQQPSVFFARPVRELRHDGSAFTQGLEFDRICEGPHALDGGGGCRDVLWESTGEFFSFSLSFFLFLFFVLSSPVLSLSFFSRLSFSSLFFLSLSSLFFLSLSPPFQIQASTESPRSGSSISSPERRCGRPSSPTTPSGKG